ncbi:MAG: NAD(P)/FAD-dependent oxidoreductase [Archaeoglobaceae archaeon]
MRAAVIGAGLGGLTSAAILSQNGYTVDVYERLPFPGGRFTSIKYKDYHISTGALHMVPHGKRGPLAQLLKQIGAEVEIEDSKPESEALWKDEHRSLRRRDFPLSSKVKLAQWTLLYKAFRLDRPLNKFEDGLDAFTANFLRSFLGWSLSVTSSDLKFSKFLSFGQQIEKYKGPGVPVGGCKSIIDSLLEVIKSNDGTVSLNRKVEGIISKDYTVKGLKVRGQDEHYDLVLSNLGHEATAKMLLDEQYRQQITELEPSSGIKFSIGLDEPFLGHNGVLFTPELERISGLNEVTNTDPNLAPNGKHLLMAHQPMLTSNLKYEIYSGLNELKNMLKKYKYEVIAIQSYSNGWPVNRVKSGSDIGNKTPYKNLYVVGDGAKGDDIEVDGIAVGISNLMRDLL